MRTTLFTVALAGALSLSLSSVGCSKDTKQATPSAPAAPLDIQGRRIDIKATFAGYEPDTIDVKPNEQVTLVFTRVTPSDCLAELTIPTYNVKKPLPINQPVAIPFKADKPGDVEFICGMNMVRGKIKVN